MTTQEEADKLFKEYRVKYFEKYFIGRNIDEVMYETSKSVVLELSMVLTKVCTLIDCFSILRHDTDYFNRLDADCKRRYKLNVIGLKSIRRRLNNILEPILQGLKGE